MTAYYARARETNRLWLESWGCKVSDFGWCVLVQHPEFQDFNAIYDISEPALVDRALELAERKFPPHPGRVTIYVPLNPRFADALDRLRRAGFRPAFRTETLATRVHRASPHQDGSLRLQTVKSDTLNIWISLYKQNYGVSGAQADLERKRWSRVFTSTPEVRFYLVISHDVAVGTAHLVTPQNRWCGIYSASMPRAQRGLPVFRLLYQQLLNEADRVGSEWVFFDRLRPVSPHLRHLHSARREVHWHGFSWAVLSADLGLRK